MRPSLRSEKCPVGKVSGMRLIMPMAGLGTRTSDQFEQPKPFIPIEGHPLFAYALTSLPLSYVNEVEFVMSEQNFNFLNGKVEETFAPYVPQGMDWSVVTTPPTRGQASTVEHALLKRQLDEQPILIASSDTIATGGFGFDLDECDGALGLFRSKNPGMSFAKVLDDKVVETAEKRVISDRASSGVYYFRDGGSFIRALRASEQQQETYVAPLYNFIIQSGGVVKYWSHGEVIPLGVTAEILAFNARSYKTKLDLMVANWRNVVS